MSNLPSIETIPITRRSKKRVQKEKVAGVEKIPQPEPKKRKPRKTAEEKRAEEEAKKAKAFEREQVERQVWEESIRNIIRQELETNHDKRQDSRSHKQKMLASLHEDVVSLKKQLISQAPVKLQAETPKNTGLGGLGGALFKRKTSMSVPLNF